ncbi:hypothetical protein OL67_003689 (plasmid) [Phaeobacter piscinae]|nr:hypothetical protein OL67_003689 [Phaeobacter piscinae]
MSEHDIWLISSSEFFVTKMNMDMPPRQICGTADAKVCKHEILDLDPQSPTIRRVVDAADPKVRLRMVRGDSDKQLSGQGLHLFDLRQAGTDDDERGRGKHADTEHSSQHSARPLGLDEGCLRPLEQVNRGAAVQQEE